MALGLALGVGLAAPTLLPVKEYFGLSSISQTGRSRWVTGEVSADLSRALLGDWWYLTTIAPGELALLFQPEARGNPAFGDYRPFSGYGNYAECASYVGALGLLVLLAGVLRRPGPGYHRFFLIASGVMLGVLLHLPGFNLVTYLPVLKFTSPSRMRFIFTLCAAISLALAVPEWVKTQGPGARRRFPLWAIAAGLAAAQVGLTAHAWGALGPQWRELSGGDLWVRVAKALAPPLAGATLAVVLFVAARRGRMAATVIVGVAALDLLLFGARWHALSRAGSVLPEPPSVRAARRIAGEARITGPPNALAPNLAKAYHLYDARVYDPISVGRFATLVQRLGREPRAPITGAPESVPALDRLTSVGGVWREDGRGEVALARAEGNLPRAYLAPRARHVHGDEALSLLAAGLNPREVTLIEGGSVTAAQAEGVFRTAVVSEYAPHRIVLRAGTERPGWLVLTDIFYPGWRATVNGRPVEIATANYAFRGVPVPAGASTVVLTFAPSSYRVGLFVGLLAVAVVAALAGGGLAPRLPRRPAAS